MATARSAVLIHSARCLARVTRSSGSCPVARVRALHQSAVRPSPPPHPDHPEKLGSRPLAENKPVADLTKEDESKITGVPNEPDDGPPPPPLAGMPAPKLFDLSGRTIVISGGGRGIGLTIAQAVLESGANVVALDLLPEPAAEQWAVAQETAQSSGLSLTYRNLDITDPSSTQSVFASVFASAPRKAPIRGLVVTAGIQYAKSALEYSAESFRKVVEVNLTGNFLSAQAFAREWVKQHPPQEGKAPPGMEPKTRLAGHGGASIVMTASMSGHIANYGLECVAYNSSKAAVHQMCRNLAMEWGKYGIRVNTLSPGYIMTAMTAALLAENPKYEEDWMRGSLLGRLSTMDEFRGPTLFMLSDASSYMTGGDLCVDGGHTAT